MPRASALVAATAVSLVMLGQTAARGDASAPAQDESIAVDANTDGCPGRAEILTALNVRLPGVAAGPQGETGRRRLVLDRPDDGAGVRLRLFDGAGGLALERRLQSVPLDVRGRHAAGVCAALAEAAAQVVGRYLKELGYHPPAAEIASPGRPEKETPGAPSAAASSSPSAAPSPPVPAPAAPVSPGAAPPSPADAAVVVPLRAPPVAAHGDWLVVAGLATSGRLGIGTGDRWPRAELLLSLQVRRRRLAFSLAAGASDETEVPVPGTQPDAALVLRAYPVRAAAGAALALPVGGLLLPAVGVSLDWITFAARNVDQGSSGRRLDAALEGSVGYLRLFGRLGVGLRLAAGWALNPRDFDARRSTPVFRTPDGYLRAELQLGFALGKDS